MSKFGDLLGKKKEQLDPISKEQAEEFNRLHDSIQNKTPKENAFANLKKTVAEVSPPATAGEGELPPGVSTPSPTPFKFNLGTKKTIASASPPDEVQSETGAVDSMQEMTAPNFSETEAAKDFQSADQPEDYTDKHVEELKQALEILTNSIDNKELVADALKNIMINVKRHVFLQDILLPEDCQLMVRSLRESYGVTIAKKQTKKKKKDTNAADVDEVLDQLADLDMVI